MIPDSIEPSYLCRGEKTLKPMEMTMHNKFLSTVFVLLFASLTARGAVASEHHSTRTKGSHVANERWRNSNGYAAGPDFPVQSYWSGLDNGAMASGPAGR
jgi:hypothetical protein